MLPTNTQQSLALFIEHLDIERNVSKLTIRNYRQYLQRFIDWFASQGHTETTQIDQESIRQYRVYLARYVDSQGRILGKKTQSYYVIALRAWLKWQIKNDSPVLHPEKIDIPKAESEHMKFLTREKLEQLLSQPLLSSEAGLRDKAILEVLFSTGLRVSELVALNREQIDLKRKEFGVIGKGRRPRVVFLSDRACYWLERYLMTRVDHWLPLFIRYSGKQPDLLSDGSEMRLTARSVQRLVDKYARQAHLTIKITPHGIRHSFATDLLANGASIRDVQEMLGHKDIGTTQIYTHVTQPRLREAHEQFHSQ